MKTEVAVARAAALALILQRCGISGATTTPNLNPPHPKDGKAVAEMMNAEYSGFKLDDETSPVGNYIRYTQDTESLFYCGSCFLGKPDCKVSGSVLNYKNMIDRDTGHVAGWFSYRAKDLSGFYVNSTKLKNDLAKCAYAWDGASDAKVNMGCGCSQAFFPGYDPIKACTPGTKDFNYSAYNNKVPPDFTETSNADSSNVKPCSCGNVSPSNLPKDGHGSQCYYKGPAFDTSRTDNPNELHNMLKRRVENQDKGDAGYGPAVTAWNEVILDGNLLNSAIMEDPAGTIVALVYSDLFGRGALDNLKDMNKNFQAAHKLAKPLPMIYLNRSVDVRQGGASPWVFKVEDQLSEMSVV